MFVLPVGFRLKASIIPSSSFDNERALLDLGTGTILVVPDPALDDTTCSGNGSPVGERLLDELLKAGFIEHIDTVPQSV